MILAFSVLLVAFPNFGIGFRFLLPFILPILLQTCLLVDLWFRVLVNVRHSLCLACLMASVTSFLAALYWGRSSGCVRVLLSSVFRFWRFICMSLFHHGTVCLFCGLVLGIVLFASVMMVLVRVLLNVLISGWIILSESTRMPCFLYSCQFALL
jgi:hypothetical protein